MVLLACLQGYHEVIYDNLAGSDRVFTRGCPTWVPRYSAKNDRFQMKELAYSSFLLRTQNEFPLVPPLFGWSEVGSEVESLVFGADVKDTKVLQRHAMAQMLMERSILEQETDRDLDATTFCTVCPMPLGAGNYGRIEKLFIPCGQIIQEWSFFTSGIFT